MGKERHLKQFHVMTGKVVPSAVAFERQTALPGTSRGHLLIAAASPSLDKPSVQESINITNKSVTA